MSSWTLFPHMIVRTTGFSWSLLERVRFPQTVAAERARLASEETLTAFKKAAPRLHRPSKAVVSALKNNRPIPVSEQGASEALFSEWNRVALSAQQAEEAVEKAFSEEEQKVSAALAELCEDPRFREAVASSSPPVFLDLERSRMNNRVVRQVGSYLQRLCSKNETMSFFGPINYGTCDPQLPQGVALSWSGPTRLVGRNTYAASWLVQGISKKIAFDPEILPWLVLRRRGFERAPSRNQRRVQLGEQLIRMRVLSPDQLRKALTQQLIGPPRKLGAVLLENKQVTPDELEVALTQQTHQERGIGDGADKEDLLELLVAKANGVKTLEALSHDMKLTVAELGKHARNGCDRGLLTHQLEIPAAAHHPIDDLIERLAGLPGASARKHLLNLGKVVEQMRRYSGAPARTKVEMSEQLRELAREVWDVGSPLPAPQIPNAPEPRRELRGEGHNFYADRLPMREECGGDLSLQIGGTRASELSTLCRRALELMGEAACRTRVAARVQVAKLLGERTLPFWKVISALSDRPIPYDTRSSTAIREAIKDPSVREVELGPLLVLGVEVSTELPLITSVDLLVSAHSVEDWNAGNYRVVMGDVHDTALVWGWALQFHPQRLAVETEMIQLLGSQPRAMPLITALASRRTGLLPSELPGPVVEVGAVSTKASGWRLPLDDLFVQSDGSIARLWSGSLQSEVSLYNGELESLVHTAFSLPRVRPLRVDLGEHTPRLLIDGVVLQREQWRLATVDLKSLIDAGDDRERLRTGVRIWRARGLPDRVFAKFTGERKPVLVDVMSPLLLRVFCNLLEQKQEVVLSEMFPAPDQLWLKAQGGAHTSELRCTFVRAPEHP